MFPRHQSRLPRDQAIERVYRETDNSENSIHDALRWGTRKGKETNEKSGERTHTFCLIHLIKDISKSDMMCFGSNFIFSRSAWNSNSENNALYISVLFPERRLIAQGKSSREKKKGMILRDSSNYFDWTSSCESCKVAWTAPDTHRTFHRQKSIRMRITLQVVYPWQRRGFFSSLSSCPYKWIVHRWEFADKDPEYRNLPILAEVEWFFYERG